MTESRIDRRSPSRPIASVVTVTEPVRIVIGPLGGGIAEAVAATPGVEAAIVDSPADIPDALADAPVLVTFLWLDDWLTDSLRWVQSVSAGTDQFPIDRFADRGVVLTSATGIHEVQVSEHAIGLLLAMTRGIASAARDQAAHVWRRWMPAELAGMTLGVLGLGTIGEGIARRAAAFGMRVIGTKREPDGYRGVADEVFGPDATLEVCRRADVVIVTLPGTPETEGVIGAEELEALRGGWLVNVGRGSVVDTEALVAAMQQQVLAGAALDVFDDEPLPASSPLWDLPGVLISPHLAGLSPHYGERLAALFARNLPAYRGESEWINRVV
jgi:phosphoglycerate dehydrogenase-like enzyme